MKRLPSGVIKTFFLIALGFIGYKFQPVIYPQQTEEKVTQQAEKTVVVPEKKPLITKEEETPKVVIPKKEEPKPEAAKIENKPKPKQQPKAQPKKTSPLDSAFLLLVGNNASSKAELDKDTELLEYASYHGEWEVKRAENMENRLERDMKNAERKAL